MALPRRSRILMPLDIDDLQAPLVRIVTVIAGMVAVGLLSAAFVLANPGLMLQGLMPVLVAIVGVVMILSRRESVRLILVIIVGLIVVSASASQIPAVTITASTSLTIVGIGWVLFIQQQVERFLILYATVIVAANFMWYGRTVTAAVGGIVAGIGFVAGAIGLLWIRDRSLDSSNRFQNLFDRAPVSLWEEDFSRVGVWLEELRAQGVVDLEVHLRANPSVLRYGMGLIEVTRVNRAAVEFLEADGPEALVGPLHADTFPDEAIASMLAQFLAVWKGDYHATTEVRDGYTFKGNPIDGLLSWSVPMRLGRPDLSKVIVSVVDVTEMHNTRRELEASLRSKDELIATVSHELRTPLTTVVGLSTELSDANANFDESEARDLLKLIQEQSLEVATIVEDLLVAARAESGSLHVMTEPVDLVAEAENTVRISDGGAHLFCEDRCRIPAVLADAGRVRQILRNLLVNADRYGTPPINVVVRAVAGTVLVEVRDQGLPIPEDERVAIFERYYRARQTPGVTASVGLGLTVSRELARLMGGDITYRHDGESVFTLAMPAVEQFAPAASLGGC